MCLTICWRNFALVVFHLLNRLIKGVLGSVLSAPRFPLPPFHYLPSIQVFPSLGALSPPHLFLAHLRSRFSPPLPSTPFFVCTVSPFHFNLRCVTAHPHLLPNFVFNRLILSVTMFGLGIFLLLYSYSCYSPFVSFVRIQYSFVPNVFCFLAYILFHT